MPLGQAKLLSDKSAPLEDSITTVDVSLGQMIRTQRYFRLWENRGYNTVKGTQ